jgi:hypothetical protein
MSCWEARAFTISCVIVSRGLGMGRPVGNGNPDARAEVGDGGPSGMNEPCGL